MNDVPISNIWATKQFLTKKDNQLTPYEFEPIMSMSTIDLFKQHLWKEGLHVSCMCVAYYQTQPQST